MFGGGSLHRNPLGLVKQPDLGVELFRPVRWNPGMLTTLVGKYPVLVWEVERLSCLAYASILPQFHFPEFVVPPGARWTLFSLWRIFLNVCETSWLSSGARNTLLAITGLLICSRMRKVKVQSLNFWLSDMKRYVLDSWVGEQLTSSCGTCLRGLFPPRDIFGYSLRILETWKQRKPRLDPVLVVTWIVVSRLSAPVGAAN